MKILLLCTAYNSLAQRLYLALSRAHDVSIEYALCDLTMISAVALAKPDLIICPFLIARVPYEVYESFLTLIVHPGPPGDIGPSALDWVLMGDDGSINNSNELLAKLDAEPALPGRKYWAVTVLQATGHYDAGPVWAFEQFELDIDEPGLTKSALYRGSLTQAALVATVTAISRIQGAVPCITADKYLMVTTTYSPNLCAHPQFAILSVSANRPFEGGKLHHRPLLKAAQRSFDVSRHTAQRISRNIRSGDSQPGVFSGVFGPGLYVYGGTVEDNAESRLSVFAGKLSNPILGIRHQAVCIATYDGLGVWITHVRRRKGKNDQALWPKVTAVAGLLELGLLTPGDIDAFDWQISPAWKLSSCRTFQDIWIDIEVCVGRRKTAYLYFDFYNGAMSTEQCSRLIQAMTFIIDESTRGDPIQAVVLMGGSYFSNGIALNVIEAATDPAMESWLNINRLNDVVYQLLHEFPSRDIVTFAAMRGNAAAGGVALAAACDIVIAGNQVVLNPAYRAMGLSGSEYHNISYPGRCGQTQADRLLRSMTPISALDARSIGLVDYIFPGTGAVLDEYIRSHISYLLRPGIIKSGAWKLNIDLSASALANIRAYELGEMAKDFWSARSLRYHTRRFDFVRKVKPTRTPLRLATHRRHIDSAHQFDEEELEDFDVVAFFQNRLDAEARNRTIAEFNESRVKEDLSDIEGDEVAFTRSKKSMQGGLAWNSRPFGPLSHPTGKTLFACYYEPSVDELGVVTPPETPNMTNEEAENLLCTSFQ